MESDLETDVPQDSEGLSTSDHQLLIKVYYAMKAVQREFEETKEQHRVIMADNETRLRDLEKTKYYLSGAIAVLGGVPFVIEIIKLIQGK